MLSHPSTYRIARLALFAVCGFALSSPLACSSDDSPSGNGNTAGSASAGNGNTAGNASAGNGNAAGNANTGGTASAGNGNAAGNASAGNGNSGGAASAGNGALGGEGGAAQGGSATSDYWKPKAGLTWQWQLSEPVGTPLDVDVYDIDWESDKATVDELHASGIKVICYVSVGSWEDFRPDAGDFPESVIGNDYDGWPGEKYVDIRSSELRAIMSKRFDVCQAKGFDAIEPDNQDVYDLGAASGFPLTKQDGVAYAEWLAAEAHTRGMSIGQKNAPNITEDIVALYDWALTESCYSDDDWCGDVQAYVDADKPVFMCEYESASFSDACSSWQSKRYSPILKSLELDEPVTFCP
ncbi:MAG: endo alpha-1,4 polygalactosaminidase [Myxococcales bacterium]|nr:MAG: endo alpha-1,4 polygalactosaminidase [Myxococcales bacterium]